MSIPANSDGGWKAAMQQSRLSGNASSYAAKRNFAPEPQKATSSSRNSLTKKKDDSPPVTPDSTTEPPPRPVKLFQEGDDVFFHDDDGQLILGTVGQIVGQTCQVLFGDGTQHWASFKRIKKLSAGLDDDDSTNSNREPESEPNRAPAVVPKEEAIELFCTVCGVKKKIPLSKARTFKPEGPNVFKCRKCNKLSETSSHNRSLSSFFKLPAFKGHAQTTSVIPNPFSATALLQYNGITIPTASGSLSIFRQTPVPATPEKPSNDNHSTTAKSSSPVGKSSKPLQPIAGPSRLKSNLCFNCEEATEPDDRIACNLCGRFCHLICLPLTKPPPPKGDRFWDLMCSSCGTQNNDAGSRSRVFSVRRNVSSWSDVACLVLSCINVEKPSQQFFDLDTEILYFLEKNMSDLKLPRHYTLPSPEDRKKFIIHALCTSRLRFINGKEMKYRTSLWGLRSAATDSVEHKVKQEASAVQKVDKPDKASVRVQFSSSEKCGHVKSSRKQAQPTKRIVGNPCCEEPKKKAISMPFGMVPSPTPSLDSELHNGSSGESGSILNLANFVQTQTASALSNQHRNHRLEIRRLSDQDRDHEMKRKQIKRLHSVSPRPTPERVRKTDPGDVSFVPALKKLKLSPNSSRFSLSPVKKNSGSPSPSHLSETQSPSVDGHRGRFPSMPLSDAKKERKKKKKKLAVPVAEKDKPKAIKSSSIIPIPAQQVKAALEVQERESSSSDETPSPKKIVKLSPVKPKSKSIQLKTSANILKRSAKNRITKLKIANRGEAGAQAPPPGFKKPLGRRRNEESKNGNTKALIVNGTTASKQASGGAATQTQDWLPSRASRRIIEKNTVLEAANGDSIANLLARNSSTLMDSILYGGYSMHCLPRPPKTEADQQAELLRVYGHYRTEKQNETASILLGRSETETRSQTRRKSELFGRRTRDLNDFDSYDVVAKKVDPFGVTRYFVIWKGDDDESGSEFGGDVGDLLDFDSVNDIDDNVEMQMAVKLKTTPEIST